MCPKCGGLRPQDPAWHAYPETLKLCACTRDWEYTGPQRWPSWPTDPWTFPDPTSPVAPDEPWTVPGDPDPGPPVRQVVVDAPPRTVLHFNGPHGYSVRLWRDAETGAIAVSAAALGPTDGGATTRVMMPQNSENAARMAAAAFVEANPDLLPILADALEEDPSVVVDGLGLGWLCAVLRSGGFVAGGA